MSIEKTSKPTELQFTYHNTTEALTFFSEKIGKINQLVLNKQRYGDKIPFTKRVKRFFFIFSTTLYFGLTLLFIQKSIGFIGLGFYCLISFLIFLYFAKKGKKMALEGIDDYFESHKLLQEQLTFTLTSDMITINQEHSSTRLRWDMVYRIVRTKEYLLIFESTRSAYTIPLHQLTDQLDVDMLFNRFKDHMNEDQLFSFSTL